MGARQRILGKAATARRGKSLKGEPERYYRPNDHVTASSYQSILDGDAFQILEFTNCATEISDTQKDFGPFRFQRKIGQGGMGEVLLFKDENAERLVAIKFLLLSCADQHARTRFLHEVRTLARLEHSLITRLYDAGVYNQFRPYFIMEYVEGLPIDEYCLSKALSVQDRLRLFISVCEAVQYAHSRLVLHRDLKPSNILVTKIGTPKLLDFGIAKWMEKEGTVATGIQTELRFTPSYAAPEQLRREPLGVYTDVYALGLILYELLTGKLPYSLKTCTPSEAEALIVSDREAEKPSHIVQREMREKRSDGLSRSERSLWNDLDILILTASKKDPQRRYPSVVELSQDIERLLNQKPLRAQPDRLRYRMSKFVRRNLRPIVVTTLVFAVLVAIGVAFTIRLTGARDAAVAEAVRTSRIKEFMLNLFGNDDQQAAPADTLRVATLLDRGAQRTELLKSDPQTQAELYQTLGRVNQQLKRFEAADRFLLLGVEKMKVAFGDDHPKTGLALVQLGSLRGDEARSKEALQLIRRGLEIENRRPRGNFLGVATAQSALGRALAQAGLYKDAIATLNPVIHLPLGGTEGNVILLESLTAIAFAEQTSGQYDNARTHHTRALEIDRRINGPGHPRVAADLSNLAGIAAAQGSYAEAERLYRDALSIDTAYYAFDNPDVAQIKSFLARILVTEHKDEEAYSLLNEVLPVQEKSLGAMHPDLAPTLDSLGYLSKRRGNLKQAASYFGRAYSILKNNLGAGDPHTLLSAAGLTETLAEQRQYAQAEHLLRELSEVPKPAHLTNQLASAILALTLGEILSKQGKYVEAEQPLLLAYGVFRERPTEVYVRLERTCKDLATLYDATGRSDFAVKFRAEAKRVRH